MKVEVGRFINTQCIDFGLTINWNWRKSVEISFLFWRIEFLSEGPSTLRRKRGNYEWKSG